MAQQAVSLVPRLPPSFLSVSSRKLDVGLGMRLTDYTCICCIYILSVATKNPKPVVSENVTSGSLTLDPSDQPRKGPGGKNLEWKCLEHQNTAIGVDKLV